MRRFVLLFLLGLSAAAQAQNNISQTTVIDTVPNTMVIDSSDVKMPSSCEFRGPVSRNSPRTVFGGSKAAMNKLQKAAADVGANVIVVTVLNTNSGVPMSGMGYRCSDLSEITPSLKVYVLPEK